jgi:hypothetical protein
VLLCAPCRGRNFPSRQRQNRGDEIGRFLVQRSEEQVGEEHYGRHESEQHPQRDGQAAAVDPNPWSCVDPLVAVDGAWGFGRRDQVEEVVDVISGPNPAMVEATGPRVTIAFQTLWRG